MNDFKNFKIETHAIHTISYENPSTGPAPLKRNRNKEAMKTYAYTRTYITVKLYYKWFPFVFHICGKLHLTFFYGIPQIILTNKEIIHEEFLSLILLKTCAQGRNGRCLYTRSVGLM
jgi:hypothetical protein